MDPEKEIKDNLDESLLTLENSTIEEVSSEIIPRLSDHKRSTNFIDQNKDEIHSK